MKKIITLFAALFVLDITGYGQVNGKLLVSARLSGAQEVPSVNTGASGVAGFLLSENRDSLFVNVSVANLSGPVTGIHIHEAARGTNGAVVKDLAAFAVGTSFSSVITGVDLTNEMITKLLSGKYYVNVHTTANPNGEIRGQLELEADWGFWGMLEGTQEVPPSGSTAMGWVVTRLSKDKSTVDIWAVFRGLTGPVTGAHFHNAAMGNNGPVVADLTSDISGNTIVATVSAASFVDDLIAGNIYLNVHTAAHPNGEIRAQMMLSDKMNHVAWLDGAQEVPATSAVGKGVALFRVNQTMDSLWYNVIVDSLSGAITGAHIHGAPKGVNGGVLVNLSGGINGHIISGIATGVSKADLKTIMRGDSYVNVHTAANANGEVRGQLWSLARSGFSTVINGLNEVPLVATSAMGSGIVSLDGMMENAHYMFVVNGLSGPITGAHFHNAAMGMNGSVVHDISATFGKNGSNDSAFGYWKGIGQVDAMNLVKGLLYVNIHTTLNANGEIRGQVTDHGQIAQLPTGIFNPGTTTANIYPNPATKQLYVSLEGDLGNAAKLAVLDLQGKQMAVQNNFLNTGQNQIEVNIENLPQGVYLLNVETEGMVQVARFVKQ